MPAKRALALLVAFLALAGGSADVDARQRARRRARADAGHGGWHRRERSVPLHEGQWIRQRLAGVKVTPDRLVSVRGQVAGADPIKRRRGRTDAERWLVSHEIAAALVELRAEVKRELGPQYDVWLNGAFDSGGRLRGRQSMHSSGRAVDLDLYRLGVGKARGYKLNNRLGDLAPIAARVFTRQVGADGRLLRGWVLHEGNHLHISLESPSVGGSFPPDPPPSPPQVTPPERRHGPVS